MPNTSNSVPFLLSSSMQSIRSRRTSTCLSSGPLGSGSGLLQQLGSGVVRQITQSYGYSGGSGSTSSMQHHPHLNGMQNRTYVRKCPSLNITFTQ
jgi:SCY1-like protein 2